MTGDLLARVATEHMRSFELRYCRWASAANTRSDTDGTEQWAWFAIGRPQFGSEIHGEHPTDPVAALEMFWSAWDDRKGKLI